ncbi:MULTISPECIES: phage minor capsid protein [Dorea]|uniref:phage minor capsid protein n=1 Tax=Dorea TaxID=189330 RepID=UPI000C7906A1|nr:phage minor capsid protein [Dorea phocaeensis]
MNLLKNQQEAETIDSVYIDLEARLMQNIARHLRDWEQLIDTDRWLMQKLAEIGKLNKENIKIIAQMSGLSQTAASRMLNAMAEEAIKNTEPGFQYMARQRMIGVVDAEKSKSVKRVMHNLRKQAKDSLNLTNTTMLHKAQEAFKTLVQNTAEEALKIMNNNTGAVITGAESRQQALRKTIRQFNDKGITGFVDKRGRNWTPEAYVNMAMRTTAGSVANEVQTARCEDMRVNLIQIDSHSGARPKCAKDQGKIFDLNNESGYTEDLNGRKIRYYPWNSSSYGEPDGILGINCGHHKYPFIPGVNIQRYFPTEDMDANNRLYKQTQVQRALERDVRKQKRECMLFDELGDPDAFEEASVKLKSKEAQLKDYVKKHDHLHRRKDREQVVGFDKRISAEAFAANKRMQNIGKMANINDGMNWSMTKTNSISKETKAEIVAYAKDKGINIVDLSKFDGDVGILKKQVDKLSDLVKEYPESAKKKITLTVGNLPDEDFGQTRGRTITLNAKALRDKNITEENIKKSGIFASEDIDDISVHEFGHILSEIKGNKGIEITKKAYYNIYNRSISDSEALMYLKKNVSSYSISYNGDYEDDILRGRVKVTKYNEITSEVLAKDKYKSTKFTREYLRLLREV